jgi:hypothetical protein
MEELKPWKNIQGKWRVLRKATTNKLYNSDHRCATPTKKKGCNLGIFMSIVIIGISRGIGSKTPRLLSHE